MVMVYFISYLCVFACFSLFVIASIPLLCLTKNMGKKIIPIQNPLMLSHKYDPPRYTCNNPNMFMQHYQQQPQQQYQYQPNYQHFQQLKQQQQQNYPMYLQQQQPQQQIALPTLPPKCNTAINVATTSLINKQANTPLLRSYMKPLPKLPNEFDEQREIMSSTDDLSSRPHSPSMSSSDESYSKTTEGEGDLDEEQPRLAHNSQQLNQMNHRNVNPLQWLYPCDIQVDLTSPVIDLNNLKDFEASSNTESQGQQTNVKGDSCNSFEYHERQAANSVQQQVNAVTKSPFERELQRLLQESSRVRNLQAPASSSNSGVGSLGVATSNEATNEGHTTSNSSSRQNMELCYSASNSKLSSNNLAIDGSAAGTGGSNGNISVSNSLSGNNNNHAKSSADELASPTTSLPKQNSRIPISTSFMISKHPVGLEAIKEIARNKNTSESSQM